MTPTTRRTNRAAFTLIELLVVVSIIAIVVGISFPFLRGMVRTSNVQMAANSLVTAVSGARAYATRFTPPEFLQPIDSGGGGPVRTAHDDGDGYSGAAVIVTPSNDLRIVENHAAAKDTAGDSLELHATGNLNGYRHIGKRDEDGNIISGVDDLRLPSDVAIFGIIRDPAGSGDLVLLSAPFAISFNNRGTIVVGSDWTNHPERFVVYDEDVDKAYDVNADRVAQGNNDLTGYHRGVAELNDEGRPRLPWERLEPVIGVVILDPREVSNPPYNPDQTDQYDPVVSAQILQAAESTGEILFFNRYTGQNIAQ